MDSRLGNINAEISCSDDPGINAATLNFELLYFFDEEIRFVLRICHKLAL